MSIAKCHSDKVVLEETIDKYGIGEVLEMIVEICYDKEKHLESNWQDYRTAKVWHKIGIAIERFSHNKVMPLEREQL